MRISFTERFKRQMEDEDLFKAIKDGDYKTVLTEMLKQMRAVEVCKHDKITTYRPCPQCMEEIDSMEGL